MRAKENYCEATLENLFLSLAHTNVSYQIIVQIGERNFTQVKPIITNVYKLIKKYNYPGNIELIIPKPTLYNVLGKESSDHEYWSRKLHLDFTNLLLYSSTKSGFYLHLEDDLIANDHFLNTIESFIGEVGIQNWKLLEFSTLGLLGKLLRMQDIPTLVKY